jgi:hypothetical protein
MSFSAPPLEEFQMRRTDVAEEHVTSTLKMEGICSTETAVLTRATRLHISEDVILHRHPREQLKSYVALTGWDL